MKSLSDIRYDISRIRHFEVQTPLYKIIDILEKLIDQPKEDTQAAMDEFKADLRSKVELVENALESVLAGQKAKKLVKKGE